LPKIILMLTLSVVLTAPSVAGQQRSEAPLTNASVVKLVRAGFKEKTVIAIIRSRPNRFDLEPERLIDLKRNGVTENIILTMLALDDTFIVGDDEWSNDPFFKDKPASRERRSSSPQSDESDIFGSSSGSRGQTRGRGRDGSNQGVTTTTGSATVRILRPPSEAGAVPKLEKTPTLNNDSIIQLVEAGFSEGTIIKRIENSPADFDLSPTKLGELRKRRVTDPIIAAMTAAMDDSSPKSSSPGRSGDN